jgi:hypothetical protein
MRIFPMGTLSTLTAVIGLGVAATSLAPAAHATDWSIGFGIGLPGVVVVSPEPVYVAPPPRYYGPGYYPPGYYSPGYYPPHYYRPPVIVGGVDEDDYERHHHRHHHRHHEDDDDDD